VGSARGFDLKQPKRPARKSIPTNRSNKVRAVTLESILSFLRRIEPLLLIDPSTSADSVPLPAVSCQQSVAGEALAA
jgi:hypothetical protein